jgi:hypothetical protein
METRKRTRGAGVSPTDTTGAGKEEVTGKKLLSSIAELHEF